MRNPKPHKEALKIPWNNIYSSLGLLISIISLAISIVNYLTASKQFTIVNQGYLVTRGNLAYVDDKEGQFANNIIVTDTMKIGFMQARINVNNIGNVPIKYKIQILNVDYNSVNHNVIPLNTIETILYPKESIECNILKFFGKPKFRIQRFI